MQPLHPSPAPAGTPNYTNGGLSPHRSREQFLIRNENGTPAVSSPAYTPSASASGTPPSRSSTDVLGEEEHHHALADDPFDIRVPEDPFEGHLAVASPSHRLPPSPSASSAMPIVGYDFPPKMPSPSNRSSLGGGGGSGGSSNSAQQQPQRAALNSTVLAMACLSGDAVAVKNLTSAGVPLHAQVVGRSPLQLACEGGHIEVITTLLDNGAELNASAVATAAMRGHVEAIQILLQRGADPGCHLPPASNPFYLACDNGHAEAVHQLLRLVGWRAWLEGRDQSQPQQQLPHLPPTLRMGIMGGGDASPPGVPTPTPTPHDDDICVSAAGLGVYLACQNGDPEVVSAVIVGSDRQWPLNKPVQGAEGPFQLLYVAALNGHDDVLQILLQAGAIADCEGPDGSTPLMAAAQEGHDSCVAVLLSFGADVERRRGTDGATALYLAAEGEHEECVVALLEGGAQPDASSMVDGGTALFASARYGSTQILRILLQHGADPNRQRNSTGLCATPLYQACVHGQVEIVRELLAAGATVNSVTTEGTTPLHAAAMEGWEDVVLLLLAVEGVQSDAADADGRTPLHCASEHGHANIVKGLLDSGAAVEAKTCTEETPCTLAARDGDAETLRILLQRGAAVNPQIASHSPLWNAALSLEVEAVKILREAGAGLKHDEDQGELRGALNAKGASVALWEVLEAFLKPVPQ